MVEEEEADEEEEEEEEELPYLTSYLTLQASLHYSCSSTSQVQARGRVAPRYEAATLNPASLAHSEYSKVLLLDLPLVLRDTSYLYISLG